MQIEPRVHDLGGGFVVRRLLPAAARRAVGPFVFFDHFGPIDAPPDADHDVRPHPHIGLATVTYLFDGAMQHRDSTGADQRIEPGAVNWMTAGRGIVHSERTPDDLRGRPRRSHGLQLWVALPAEHEEAEPSFQHVAADAIPVLEVGGARVRVLAGAAFGAASPVRTLSPTLYLDIALAAGDAFPLPPVRQRAADGADDDERAVYGVAGSFRLDGDVVAPGRLVLLDPDTEPMLSADGDAHVVVIGGAPLGERLLWWNFVSSRRERIAQAADDWRAQRYAPVAGDASFIPLPERGPS